MGADCIHIAIVGAGASGTITAIQLLRELNVKAKIFLIEKKPEAVYRGAAYSSKLVYEPLNVITGRMNIFNHLPDDFYNWLKENKQTEQEEEITKETYVSRRWFGDYMTARIKEAAAQSAFAELKVVNTELRDVNYDAASDNYRLLLLNTEVINADYLIFATGNETPADVVSREEVMALGKNYISNPWLGNTLDQVKPSDDVLIIGTGLTMVDHAVSLYKQNHQGNIYCLSRNGYLPLEHTAIQTFTVDIAEEPKDVYELLRLIKTKIADAGNQNVEWQNVLDAIRPHTPRLWKSLNTDSKKYFLKRLKTYWEIHRHRMPTASANAIKQMQANGQLVLLMGNIIGTEFKDDKVVFKYFTKKLSKPESLSVDFVINCTGPSGDYYKCDNVLIKNLLDKGWMNQDELKLGVRTGSRGEIIKENGVVLQNAFAVGPLRKAMEWESTAMREIRTQAENIALLIAGKAERNNEMMLEIGL